MGTVRDFVKENLLKADRENIFNVQFELLRYLEENEPLPTWLEVKIDSIVKKGFNRSYIIASAISNEIAAIPLAKKANRQRVPEISQLMYLSKVRGLNIKKLPDSGPSAVRLLNGEFSYGTKIINSTKSIDAINGSDFISLKYVQESGGAQDNQVYDVGLFLKEAVCYTNKYDNDIKFTAIVDGGYIESKIPELRKDTNSRVRVFTSDSYNY